MACNPPTRVLAARAQAGSSDAWTSLYNRTGPALKRVASARLGARARRRVDPEDVVQDAFLSVHVRSTYSETKGNWRSWMSRIVAREARRARDRTTDWTRSGLDSQHARGPTPSAAVAEEDAQAEAMRRLAALSEQDRELVRILVLEGGTYSRVREELGIPERTARDRLARAMDSLSRGGDRWAL